MSHLLLKRISTLLRNIHNIENGSPQMSHGSNGLHLNGIPLLERMIKNTRCVNNLPAQVLVVGVSDVQRLGSERVRLDLDVGVGDLVEEGRLADVREAADEQCARVRVD